MADADDFDVEELRRLLRGEGAPQPVKTPQTAPGASGGRKAPGKTGKAPAQEKAKPGKGPKRR